MKRVVMIQARKKAMMTQQDLAERVDVSQFAISAYENGKLTPSLGVALKISNILNVSVEEVFSDQKVCS